MAVPAILNVSFRASLLVLAPACTQDNPWFLLADETTDPLASAGTPSTGTPSTSSESAPTDAGGDETASSGTTGPLAETTGDPSGETSAGGSTLEPSETSTRGSSGDTTAGPGSLELPATLATCALLSAFPNPHAGPTLCEWVASSQAGDPSGVMILDTTVIQNGGGNRPAHVFFQFDIPPAVADLQLAAVRLELHLDDNQEAGGPSAGTLYQSEPVDLLSLEFGAPGYGGAASDSADIPLPGATISWQLPPEWIVPDAPLYLRIVPFADDGLLLHSNAAAAELRPQLHIDYL